MSTIKTLSDIKDRLNSKEEKTAMDIAITGLSIFDQYKWERDCAFELLDSLGIGIGMTKETALEKILDDKIDRIKELTISYWDSPMFYDQTSRVIWEDQRDKINETIERVLEILVEDRVAY